MDEIDYSNEEWRPVIGYESIYSVSDVGRVRRDKPYQSTCAGKILKQQILKRYLAVPLNNKGAWNVHVHRLVAEAFLGPCPDGCQVNHLDGNKVNNHIENLEYVTPRKNTQHAIDAGLRPTFPAIENRARGERHGRARMTAELVVKIRALFRDGMSQANIWRTLGFTTNGDRAAVNGIVRGKTWKHVK